MLSPSPRSSPASLSSALFILSHSISLFSLFLAQGGKRGGEGEGSGRRRRVSGSRGVRPHIPPYTTIYVMLCYAHHEEMTSVKTM